MHTFRYIVYTLDQVWGIPILCILLGTKYTHWTKYEEFIMHTFRYIVYTLDQYVDMDYSLVYFHHGLDRSNKPPLSWLWGFYKVNIRSEATQLLILFAWSSVQEVWLQGFATFFLDGFCSVFHSYWFLFNILYKENAHNFSFWFRY